MHPSPSNSHRSRNPAGFTLVELLIALALSLFLIGGAIVTFASGKAAYTEIQRFSDLQSNLQFIIDTITKDIRGASGPDGIMPPTDADGNLLVADPSDPSTLVAEFTVTRPGGAPEDRNCLGVAKTGATDQIINTYRVAPLTNDVDEARTALFCDTDDGAANILSGALVADVSNIVTVGLDEALNPVAPEQWPDAFALRITLTLESRAANNVLTHTVVFIVALRNRIVNTYNTVGST